MSPIASIRIELIVFNLAKNGEVVNYHHDIVSRKAKYCNGFIRANNFILTMAIKRIDLGCAGFFLCFKVFKTLKVVKALKSNPSLGTRFIKTWFWERVCIGNFVGREWWDWWCRTANLVQIVVFIRLKYYYFFSWRL